MQLKGIDIINQAFAKLGAFAPGQEVPEAYIAQAELHGTARLESLSLDSQYIPGTTIQLMEFREGVSDYWIGPSANTITPGAPLRDPAGLRTSGPPDALLRATSESEVPGSFPRFRIAEGAGEWALFRRQVAAGATGACYLYLHTGSGGAETGEARSYREDNRRLEIVPVPTADFSARLYLKVAGIMRLGRDVDYDLDPGLGELVITQTASALAPVYSVDPDTRNEVGQQASMALDRVKRKNARYRSHGAKSHLPPRWTTSVAVGDDYVHIDEYD